MEAEVESWNKMSYDLMVLRRQSSTRGRGHDINASFLPLGNEETETSVVLIQQSWRATLKEQGQTRGGGLSLLKATTHQ